MPKRWNLVAHPAYFNSLRNMVDDRNERYQLVTEIWERLEETENPREGAEPVAKRPGRYYLELGKYRLTFGLPTEYEPPELRENDIDLYLIQKVNETP